MHHLCKHERFCFIFANFTGIYISNSIFFFFFFVRGGTPYIFVAIDQYNEKSPIQSLFKLKNKGFKNLNVTCYHKSYS